MRMKHFILALCTLFIGAVSMAGCSDDATNEQKPTFTVTFDSQGGSEVASQKVVQGEKATKPANPTKEGLAFNGWYTSTEYVKEWSFEKDAVTADMTLYARWTAESWTVTFNTNGGNNIEPVPVAKGGLISDLPVPVKEGFVFEGWYTDEALSSKFDKNAPVTQDLTLYAKWVKEGDITREMLEEALSEALTYKKDNYTSESYEILQQKIREAESVLNKPQATAEEIATAYAGLKEAIAQLMPLAKRQTTNIYINPEPVDDVIYLNTGNLTASEPYLAYVNIWAHGEDAFGQTSTNSKVSFSYDEAKLKSWAKDGEITVDQENGNIGFYAKSDLSEGESIEITVTSADDTSVKRTISLKVASGEKIKGLFTQAVNALPSASGISFDNYFEADKAWNKAYSIYERLTPQQQQNDTDIQNANQKLEQFEDAFDYWWHSGYAQIEDNKYMFDGENATFTPNGNFPCGTFVTIYDISGDGKHFAKEVMTLKPDNTCFAEYGEGSDISQIPCEPEGEGEYRLAQGDSKQGILIFHLTKEYESYSKATKQSFRPQKMKRGRR